LDVLPETEARELLARYLGPQRVDTEPDAVTELLAYCAGLPLAISIVAARAVTYLNFPLAILAEELREASTRLDTFDGGDLIVNLRAVFSWSYRAVDKDTAVVFRLLGLAPGPEISLPAAASLAGLPVSRTRVLLRELENAHLVQQHLPWRYRLHDLIQLYATERAGQDHPEHDRTAALHRMIDFYVHTAHCADRLLDPHRRPITLGQPVIGCAPDPLPDAATALAWFDAEHHCLLAAQQCAERQGWYAQVWQLAWVLATFHQRRGHLHDDVAVWRLGLAAAEKLDESSLQIWAHRYLGQALIRVGRHTDAGGHLRQARAGAEQIGDVLCQVHVQCVLAWALHGQGDDQQAMTHATRALRLCQTLKVPAWEAVTLNLAGWLHARLGHYQQARTYCESALALQRHHHDREGEASTLDSLGYIARHTSRPSDAISYYHQALDVARDLGYRYAEADTLAHLGQTHATLGRLTDARHAWHQALKLYRAQHRTNEAERVQQQLDALTSQTTMDTSVPTDDDGERGHVLGAGSVDQGWP
jgi:tetratricopeptide (TPR) repeat protein